MIKKEIATASDADIIALLKRYQCPEPFHVVRALFMGSIASPVLSAFPLELIKQLWGGSLPEFESMSDAEELINVLINNGLWNRLTIHQSSRHPFMLLRFNVRQTHKDILHFVTFRQQELQGFVEGLFSYEEHVELLTLAQEAFLTIVEARKTLTSVTNTLNSSNKIRNLDQIKALIRQIENITITVEKAINRIILSCKKARLLSDNEILPKKKAYLTLTVDIELLVPSLKES